MYKSSHPGVDRTWPYRKFITKIIGFSHPMIIFTGWWSGGLEHELYDFPFSLE